MASTNDIRRGFLDYFGAHGHAVVDSSPLVPLNDPSLLFTNAGMVQFKNVFTGAEHRDYSRAATSQKCVRAGGKHNDLENVGYTARHHTFFEMLGNFSFGDYFKENAIEFAWNLVTGEFGLDRNRLLVTVYAEDEEAAGLWRKIAGLSDDRIIRIATSDNFWSMGDTGPCGPCSEIFYDHGPHIPGGPPGSPDEDGDRFIEIWNLVFMQFEQITRDQRVDLPRPSIDTGMGLERISAVMQGKHDNYDIDTMRKLIEASAEASGADADGPFKISHRVVADHLRASSFLIADGVLPANDGRGYVLRRIMRRAMRHAHIMGCTDPLMFKLVPALVAEMGQAFPELGRAEPLIRETLKLEETRFKDTLDRGLKLLEEETSKLGGGQALNGEVAFKLYDTFGFPVDLTADILRGQGRALDEEGFAAAMERQRALARKAWSGSGDTATETVWFDLKDKLGSTEFFGYSTTEAEGTVTGLVVDGTPVERAEPGADVVVVVNQTPFYGESGGQQGDTGTMRSPDGAVVAVSDTQKKAGSLWIHVGKLSGAPLAVGDALEMSVDADRRDRIRANHSATHLLHEALRLKLGDHVAQKGSLVAPDRLRFDFSQPTPIERDDLAWVEAEVNRRVRGNSEVTTRLMTPDDAIAEGAMALFGEKYGEEVRVVSMGGAPESGSRKAAWSIELCGGTHVRRTGDIGLLKIITETAVASGVRRIEAVTGEGALAWLTGRDAVLGKAAAELKSTPEDVPERVRTLIEERRKLERELVETRKKLASGGGGGGAVPVKEIAGIKFASRILDGVPSRELKGVADTLKAEIGSGAAVVISADEGKASIVVAVTEDLIGRVSAVDLVRVGSAALGGKGGGGRPDMAQAGGPDPSKAEEAVAAIEATLSETALAAS